MLNKICFIIIKFSVWFVKKIKLDISAFDKIIYCVGDVKIGQNKEKYEITKDLTETEVKIFSQNGEDGIIDFLLNRLKLRSRNFVEIGVGNYRESNTRYLYNKYHPKGLIIDCIEDMEEKVKPFVNLWKGDLRIVNKKINSDNILPALNEFCDYEIDIFSLDIDSIDYWIIDKLPNNISKIFVAEYNPVFGPDLKITVPNIEGFNRTQYHYSNLCYGMSLRALIDIMKFKGYYFIGTNLQKMNAFFISEQYKKKQYFDKLNTEELKYYTDSNIRDSRDKNYKLNFLSGIQKLKEIKDCEVVNLDNNKKELVRIKDLL